MQAQLLTRRRVCDGLGYKSEEVFGTEKTTGRRGARSERTEASGERRSERA